MAGTVTSIENNDRSMTGRSDKAISLRRSYFHNTTCDNGFAPVFSGARLCPLIASRARRKFVKQLAPRL
jgi:hypothetical protein